MLCGLKQLKKYSDGFGIMAVFYVLLYRKPERRSRSRLNLRKKATHIKRCGVREKVIAKRRQGKGEGV